jgi:4-amino-4-deoxy-L-arabinose transferase-like glycosyltransferase
MSIPSEATVIIPTMTDSGAIRPSQRPRVTRERLVEFGGIAAVLLLATFLDFYRVTRAGLGNNYYAIGVKSMSMNWHNFFFVAFDPGGFISIDKPPLALWLMVLSAKIFGYTSFGLMLPEALCGIISVWLLYSIVRATFGITPALIAAAFLATSPINVVVNRDTVLESPLIMVLLLATWAVLHATQRASWRWLLVSAVLVGLAFNIKMLEAYLVLPAFGLVYLFGAALSWRRRLLHLVAATAVLLVVSLTWAVAVDATPADQRPFVGSSSNNSVIDLIFNHNGLARFTATPPQPAAGPSSTGGTTWLLALFAPTSPHQDQGYAGPLRLIQPELGGQVGWFIPLALLGLLSGIWELRPRTLWQNGTLRALSATERQFTLWVLMFVVMAGVFSFAGHLNPQYLAVLGPVVAALAGVGLVGMWRDYATRSWRRGLLLVALPTALAEQYIILRVYPPVIANLPLLIAPLGVAAILALAIRFAFARRTPEEASQPLSRAEGGEVTPARHPVAARALVFVVLAFVACAPTLWTFDSLRTVNSGEFPLAGTGRQGDRFLQPPHADGYLLAYLSQHNPHTFFLIGTLNVVPAEGIIYDTGAPVMAFGGWGGGDQTVTTSELRTMIITRQIRYFLLPSGNMYASQAALFYPLVKHIKRHYDTFISQWIGQHCSPVPPDQWSASSATSTTINPLQLFDCG